MDINPIGEVDDFTAMELLSRQNTAPSETLIDFRNDNLSIGAIVKNESGILKKYTAPVIYSPEKEIATAERELSKYEQALIKKNNEIKILKEQDRYKELEAASFWKRDYERNVLKYSERIKNLKASAPAKIEQGIKQLENFTAILEEERSKAERLIEDANALKSRYEA
mgnify:CR=1 FL=1